MAEMSWENAVLLILEEADQPIYYGDIAEEILSRGLRTTEGKTPHFTVAGTISRLRSSGTDIIKTAPGYYCLPHVSNTYPEIAQTEPESDALDATDASDNLAVAAYGLHWEREKVDWAAGRILGYDIDPKQTINFADQQGVYLLHNWHSVVYVGRTTAKEKGLFQRLNFHHKKHVWSGKWERFSWFGFRKVDEDGSMLDGPDSASKEVVSALTEAVLIETLVLDQSRFVTYLIV